MNNEDSKEHKERIVEGRSCLSTHFSFSVASSASTVALARVMVGVVRVEEGGRGDCVCALRSMCEGDTRPLRSSLHKKPSLNALLTVGRLCLLSPAGVWRKEHIISLSHTTAHGSSGYPTHLAGSTRGSSDLKSSWNSFSDPRHSSTPCTWLCV